jgi:hypothetical protein
MANFNPQRNIGADFVNQIFGTVINSFEQAKEAKSRRSQDTFKLFFDTFAADPTNPATLNLVSRGLDGMERTPENSLHVDILETSVDAEIDKNAKFKKAMVGLDPNFVRTAENMIAGGDLQGAVDLANKQGNTLIELNEIYPKRFSDTKSLKKSLDSVQNFLGNFEDFDISGGVSEFEEGHLFTTNRAAVNKQSLKLENEAKDRVTKQGKDVKSLTTNLLENEFDEATIKFTEEAISQIPVDENNRIPLSLLTNTINRSKSKLEDLQLGKEFINNNFDNEFDSLLSSGDIGGAQKLADNRVKGITDIKKTLGPIAKGDKDIDDALESAKLISSNLKKSKISGNEVTGLEIQHIRDNLSSEVRTQERNQTAEQRRVLGTKIKRIDEIVSNATARLDDLNEGEKKSLTTLAKDVLVLGGSVEDIGNIPEDILTNATQKAQEELNPTKVETPDQIADRILKRLNTKPADTTNANK